MSEHVSINSEHGSVGGYRSNPDKCSRADILGGILGSSLVGSDSIRHNLLDSLVAQPLLNMSVLVIPASVV